MLLHPIPARVKIKPQDQCALRGLLPGWSYLINSRPMGEKRLKDGSNG